MYLSINICLFLLTRHQILGSVIEENDFKSNRTGRNLKYEPVKKSDGYYKWSNNDGDLIGYQPMGSENVVSKTPRGFADFVSGEDSAYSANSADTKPSWSPYYLPPLSEYMQNSGSSVEGNVWKREDERIDNRQSHYNPDYADMLMMMHSMKKMDSGSSSKSGILTRILDNPTTLVMATFIPMSLLIAAALPLILNVMMNGITIPALVNTVTGAKTRGFDNENSTDILSSVLESLVDFSSRYMDSPDCFQKIFCEMTIKSNKSVVPGARYIKHAANAATLIVNEDLLSSFGVKNLVKAFKQGSCEEVICEKPQKSSPGLLKVINDAIHNHSYKTIPLKHP